MIHISLKKREINVTESAKKKHIYKNILHSGTQLRIMKKFLYACIFLILSSCSSKKAAISTVKPSESSELKVMSYNIHIANPPSKPGLTDMNAIIKAIGPKILTSLLYRKWM